MGGILFFWYNNDRPDISDPLNAILCADDSTLYIGVKLTDLINNANIINLEKKKTDSCFPNRQTINTDKT